MSVFFLPMSLVDGLLGWRVDRKMPLILKALVAMHGLHRVLAPDGIFISVAWGAERCLLKEGKERVCNVQQKCKNTELCIGVSGYDTIGGYALYLWITAIHLLAKVNGRSLLQGWWQVHFEWVPRSVDMLVGYPTLILHDLQGSTSHKKGIRIGPYITLRTVYFFMKMVGVVAGKSQASSGSNVGGLVF